ncbi:phenylacetate-CoA oxygenase/reductase subunit PaaK [Pseudolysinimonas kribbensis]|uniref:Phenylacetic acid degradation NADH oxidoreductase PaaE n=1 Tax=Pseudolysinimonas kribbensis TaxID=433641 RepID=A0ABQ6K4V9_9MICO|nr:1,2-phenylacetyl-CoA epoxidase subunit PaaE [Pseudolysinimonas kribbensis]GMA94595.1 phenylacetic acid degradation NADH oxidoreductase PaaE [Pseudolysinimonas kribbensis]
MAAQNLATRRRARFHPLAVREVRPLTPDSIEVAFAVPPGLHGDYDYAPGQYVALRTRLASPDGLELRRSYSICQPPEPGELRIAIKRDVGGRFSTWALEQLAPGMTLDVMSPQGTFTTDLAAAEGRHFAAIAAGSGVTPVMALVRAVLGGTERARFSLVYTNRTSLEVMFLEELADLKDRYRQRLALHHVLTREERTSRLLSGRIDAERLDGILAALVRPADVDEWFLCGPLDLVELCRARLTGAGVAREAIRFELFTTGRPEHPMPAVAGRAPDPAVGVDAATVRFTLDGRTSTVVMPQPAVESVLNAALRVRADVPFACTGGVCGTCRARLREGSVRMAENFALEPDELEAGYVLTCQSHPTSPAIVVDYDA